MKIEWLVADVTAVGSLDRAKHAIFRTDVCWACILLIQVMFVVREPLCGVGTPSWALIPLLRVIE